MAGCAGHVRQNRLDVRLRLLIRQPLGQSTRLFNCRGLRKLYLVRVAGEGLRQLLANLAANQLPGSIDNLLLQLGELLGVLSVLSLTLLLLTLLLLAARWLLPLSENLF